jgi:hypothetical protein
MSPELQSRNQNSVLTEPALSPWDHVKTDLVYLKKKIHCVRLSRETQYYLQENPSK